MRHSIVIIDGLRWWRTDTGLDIEFEPVEVQARELTIRQKRNGDWELERVYSYARSGRNDKEIRITKARFVKRDVVFRQARKFLTKTNAKYE